MVSSESAVDPDTASAVKAFDYTDEPVVFPDWQEWDLVEVDVHGAPLRVEARDDCDLALANADLERRIEEERARSFEAGRERGRLEGRAAECEAHGAARAQETTLRTEELGKLMESFTAQRDGFFARAEQEIVRLALSIAARILRREAQTDPLLLLGAVRVALGQLSSTTEAGLHVPAEHADLWKEAIALLPRRTLKPQVIADDDLRLGECRLETDLGSVDLAVSSQLNEIEGGFFGSDARAVSAGGITR